MRKSDWRGSGSQNRGATLIEQGEFAKAIADSVADGVIKKGDAENLVCVCGVFIHPGATDDKKIYDYNYTAVKESIERAVRGDPQPSEVVAKRNSVKHPFSPK